ncbi:MAG: hypothetical protein K2K24_00990, partial [Clostridia bacterium]|nr:hypothetical protein [Clostridia bacterium]
EIMRVILGGSDGVVFKLKDGSERKFSIIGAGLRINGKQYKCHSYLSRYIYWFGYFDEYFEAYMSELS